MRRASHHVEVQGSLFYGTNSVPNGETFKSPESQVVHICSHYGADYHKKCKLELFFLLHKVKYSVNKK